MTKGLRQWCQIFYKKTEIGFYNGILCTIWTKMTVFTVVVLCHLHNLACPFNKKAFVPGYSKAACPIAGNLNTIRNTLLHTCLQRKLTPMRMELGNVMLQSASNSPSHWRGWGVLLLLFLFSSSTITDFQKTSCSIRNIVQKFSTFNSLHTSHSSNFTCLFSFQVSSKWQSWFPKKDIPTTLEETQDVLCCSFTAANSWPLGNLNYEAESWLWRTKLLGSICDVSWGPFSIKPNHSERSPQKPHSSRTLVCTVLTATAFSAGRDHKSSCSEVLQQSNWYSRTISKQRFQEYWKVLPPFTRHLLFCLMNLMYSPTSYLLYRGQSLHIISFPGQLLRCHCCSTTAPLKSYLLWNITGGWNGVIWAHGSIKVKKISISWHRFTLSSNIAYTSHFSEAQIPWHLSVLLRVQCLHKAA